MSINVCNLIQSQHLDFQMFLRGKFSLRCKGVLLGYIQRRRLQKSGAHGASEMRASSLWNSQKLLEGRLETSEGPGSAGEGFYRGIMLQKQNLMNWHHRCLQPTLASGAGWLILTLFVFCWGGGQSHLMFICNYFCLYSCHQRINGLIMGMISLCQDQRKVPWEMAGEGWGQGVPGSSSALWLG